MNPPEQNLNQNGYITLSGVPGYERDLLQIDSWSSPMNSYQEHPSDGVVAQSGSDILGSVEAGLPSLDANYANIVWQIAIGEHFLPTSASRFYVVRFLASNLRGM